MFTVERADGPIPTLTLTDASVRSEAVLAPARGGMLTRFAVAGRELFYLDRASFEDRTANVRGGNPVLFPSPGKLAGDAWVWGGAHGAMKQHGFARNLAWEIAATGTDDGAYATLVLRSSDVTRAQFPWDFVAEYTYRLRTATLAIEMRITNTSASPMPFGAGFHPYFALPDAEKPSVRIDTRATRAFDNAAKRAVPFTGFDLTLPEVDLHLLDHGSTEASIAMNGACVTVRGSHEFTHWVVWTLKGRDFVCLEPWSCPGNALNTGDRLIVLAPGESRSLRIAFEAAV